MLVYLTLNWHRNIQKKTVKQLVRKLETVMVTQKEAQGIVKYAILFAPAMRRCAQSMASILYICVYRMSNYSNYSLQRPAD